MKLDSSETVKVLEDIEQGSNIIELVCSDFFEGYEIEKNKILCDGKVKAQLVVEKQWAVEIMEDF